MVQPDGPDKPKRYQVVSRNAPNKRPDVTTGEGRKKIGETVDALAEVFENKVARNLGVAAERVSRKWVTTAAFWSALRRCKPAPRIDSAAWKP
ncbi:hypothetical protein ACPA9J_11250 [Pseudomonas aeruginosa]